MNKYLLAVDNGGTNIKAVLFDTKGVLTASASFPTPRIEPLPDHREVEMDTVWHAVCRAINEVIAKACINAEQIACVTCVGHGKGLYLLNNDGIPARNGILSTDNRAWPYIRDWQKDGTAEKTRAIAKQSVLSMQAPPLLRWIKDNEPDVYKNIRHIFEAKDFIRFMLTGEAYAEITDYSGTNVMNLEAACFEPELFRLFGIDEMYELMPPLCLCTDICGAVTADAARLTGLTAGTPVAGGMFDIDACAVAMNVLDEDLVCVIAGTWSINEYISKSPVQDGTVLMNSLFCQKPYYLVEECSPTSAGNLEIFIKQFMPEHDFDTANELVAETDPASHRIIFLPFMYGSNIGLNSKAAILGLSSANTKGQILQAIYEGVVFSHRYHIDKLISSKKTPTRSVRLAGGAARSLVWTQIFANVLGQRVETVCAGELGALGGAMAGAAAVGIYRDLSDASQNMTKIKDIINPNLSLGPLFDEKYELYVKAAEALLPLWG